MYRRLALSFLFSAMLVGTASADDPQPGDIIGEEGGEMAICSCSGGSWTPEPCMLPGTDSCPPGDADIVKVLNDTFEDDGSLTRRNSGRVKYFYLGNGFYGIAEPVRSRSSSGWKLVATTKPRRR